MNLNVHFHLVVPDGVFVDDDAHGLRFELLPVPTNAEVLAILDRLMRQIARRLASLANADGVDEDARPDVLAQVQADAAATWRSSTETRATVRGVERLRACRRRTPRVRAGAPRVDRRRVAYKLKRPWPDGRTHLVMEPACSEKPSPSSAGSSASSRRPAAISQVRTRRCT